MSIITASLPTVLQQVASLSNSSTWFSFNATIPSSSTLLTALYGDQPFQSTANDAGKAVVIRAAGAAGADLITTIATVSSVTVANVNDTSSFARTGAICAMGGNYNDDRHAYPEIIEAIFEADEQLMTAIAETKDHWARADILTLSGSISNAAQVPSRTSVVGDVLVKNSSSDAYLPATLADLKAIQRYNANTGTAPLDVYGSTAPTAAGSPLAGYYCIDPDGILFYTGTDAKIRVFQYNRTTLLQSPSVYQNVIVYGALRALCAKDGDDPSSAAAWGKFWLDGISAVRLGAMNSLQG